MRWLLFSVCCQQEMVVLSNRWRPKRDDTGKSSSASRYSLALALAILGMTSNSPTPRFHTGLTL
jgi:hypothetical protein